MRQRYILALALLILMVTKLPSFAYVSENPKTLDYLIKEAVRNNPERLSFQANITYNYRNGYS
jgi:hypothetical protein